MLPSILTLKLGKCLSCAFDRAPTSGRSGLGRIQPDFSVLIEGQAGGSTRRDVSLALAPEAPNTADVPLRVEPAVFLAVDVAKVIGEVACSWPNDADEDVEDVHGCGVAGGAVSHYAGDNR